ncbi:MAG: TIGR00297 family protein [Archaeoglobaceae archaeon]|uniref:TIGR00297 family protein n=1 Tax=Archaeoglobus fulgidus TaxID=2234 RepID=A0A7J3M173_ARCFL
MFQVLLSLVALVGILLDPRLIFAIALIATFFYAVHFARDFEVLVTATILSALAIFMQKEIIYASFFLLFFYEFRRYPLWDIAIYTSASILYFSLFSLINAIFLPAEYIVFISLAGALSAALMETIKTNADKRVLLLIAVATTFAIFRIYIPTASLQDLAIAFTISFLVSLLALKAKIADESGLMSATIVGTVTILFTDLSFFAILLVFYLLGSIVTKYRYSVKLSLGIAEPSGGARGFSNVFGNSLAPLFFAMNFGVTRDPLFALAFVATVGTALGDTMASEIGKTAKNVYLITNFKKVAPGTSGGISVIGEISALLGCLIIFVVSLALGISELSHAIPIVLASFIGVHVDSFLGATLEEKGYLNNSAVNFLGTLSAGALCYLFLML